MNDNYTKVHSSEISQEPENHTEEMASKTILVDRPLLTIEDLHQHGAYDPPIPITSAKFLKSKVEPLLNCSRKTLWQFIVDKIPILGWLPSYNLKEWLNGDIMAGITVAIMQIPLGMAFALLAHLPAIVGIYMAFYQVLIYAFFGTSHHCSMGAFAVITLMTGKVVKQLATFPPDAGSITENGLFLNETDFNETELLLNATSYTPIQVATAVCFTTGVWQMIIGILQLGCCSVLLSDMLVSGFTTAAAIHVFTSQIKDMLGLTIASFSGPFKIIYTYIEIFSSLGTISLAPTLITMCAVLFLFFMNEFIKPRLAKKTKIPIPSELLVVVGATLISRYAYFNKKFDVSVVGNIPTGLPPPAIPPLELMGIIAVDSLIIAIVSYAIDFSVAKIFALRRGYKVDATQELYAHGISNIGSSFFSCAPMAAALARTLVQESVGGVTQIASLVSCIVSLLVLLFVGPFFESLPKAILASVIAVALKGMFLQVRDVIKMWKISKIDATVWLVSFFATVIIDIDMGLLIGVVFSLFVLIVRNQNPAVLRLGKVPKTDLYLDMEFYPEAKKTPGLTVLRLLGSIHFANRENLKCEMQSKFNLDTEQIIENGFTEKDVLKEHMEIMIVDISGINYVDTAGAKFLSNLKTEYGKINVAVYIVGISDEILATLNRCKALENYSKFELYHSIHDAYTYYASSKEM